MSGSQGTPQYPPPPALGSQGYNSFDQEEPSAIDLGLINPPGTEPRVLPPPAGTSLPSPGENKSFVLPPADGAKSGKKKKLKKQLGGLGDSFKGGFSKVRGKLKKAPKIQEESNSIEDASDEDVSGSREVLDYDEKPTSSAGVPGIYETAPGTEAEDKQALSRRDNLALSLRNILKKPQNADPSPYQAGDVIAVELEETSKNYITFGNFINVMLICFIVAGIIMCACIGVNDALYYIGPAALGLGFFALIGKCFFTIFWKEDPLPNAVKPALYKFESLVGGNKDPYGFLLEKLPPKNPGVQVYYGPMSTTARQDVVQMETFNYPRTVEPKMYDESIDTRMRPVIATGSNTNLYSETPSYPGLAYPSSQQPTSASQAVKPPW